MQFVCISDTHLGSVFSKSDLVYQFLNQIPESWNLVLLGDIVDTWKALPDDSFYFNFKSRPIHLYLPGNHDEELIVAKILNPGVMKQFMLTLNKKNVWFTHGDIFDSSYGSDSFVNRVWDALLYKISIVLNTDLRSKLRNVTDYFYDSLSPYYTNAVKMMQAKNADYLIYGHTHCPGIKTMDERTLINLGSWYDDPRALFVKGDRYAYLRVTEDFLFPEEKDFDGIW